MVLLAASVSLRFFRFGGVQKMILSGISAGFLLFVLSKITEDMSKSELLSPVAAAWIPVVIVGLTVLVALVYPWGAYRRAGDSVLVLLLVTPRACKQPPLPRYFQLCSVAVSCPI